MTVVTFQADIFPHVKNSIVDLDKDEKKRVDQVAKSRGVEKPYVEGAHESDDVVTNSREAIARIAKAERAVAEESAAEQAAALEAQNSGVAEPAHAEAVADTEGQEDKKAKK